MWLLASSRQPSARRLAEAGLLRAAAVALNSKAQLRQFHGSAPAAAADGPGAAALDAALAAFSPAEPLGASGLSPIVLGTSVWEVMHAATGLPWWASIPLTTLALRTALLPLTVKARAAAVNFALMRQADAASRSIWDRMQQEQAAAAAAAGGGGGGGRSGSSGRRSASGGGGAATAAKAPGKAVTRTQLTKQYLAYMRRQHGTPSIWWYNANALVQINVFLSMSAALRQMSAMAWPGFDSEGLAWFADMTQPAVEWGTWACPYGVAGVFLPLVIFGAYVRTLEYTSVAKQPRLRAGMELATFPLFLASCVVPHATALYWLTNGAFGLGLQAALCQPKLAAALGLPMVAVHARGEGHAAVKSEIERRQAEGAAEGSDDLGFIKYLAADTLSRGQYAAAAACLKRLTSLQPRDAGAWRHLAAASGRLGRWAASAEAHERAGDLMFAALQRQGPGAGSSSGGSGDAAAGGGGGAQEAGAEYVAAAVAHLNAASAQQRGAGAGSDDEDAAAAATAASSGKLAHVGRALELLHQAEAKAGIVDADTLYYTCMGRLATGQLQSALEAAQRSWELTQARAGGDGSSSSSSSGGGGGGSNTAADASRLALPLGRLCQRLALQGGAAAPQQLQRAADLAAEVGAASGSNGTRGDLRDALESAADSLDARRGCGSEGAYRLRELAAGLL